VEVQALEKVAGVEFSANNNKVSNIYKPKMKFIKSTNNIMYTIIKPAIIGFIFMLMIIVGCKKSEIGPENIFTKIYSDSNSDISYYPLDFVETSSGEYYILASTSIDTTRTWLNTFVMKTDKFGELIWSSPIDLPFVNPVSKIVFSGGNYYFVCMDAISLSTHLLKIDEASQSAVLVNSYPEILYPLAASKTPDNGILLLNYDRVTRQSSINKLDAGFNVSWQTKYFVNEDSEEQLIDHLIKTGKNIPFFTGTIGEGSASYYFANGLSNYTLSLLFVKANGERSGIAQGFRYDGGAGALLNMNADNFALARFNFGEHFILPGTVIDVNSISNLSDLQGAKLDEIDADAEARILKITIDGKPAHVFATNTNNNQVILYIYDSGTNLLLQKKYLGFAYPVKVASIIQTADLGLAILVQTMVTGRFKRISFYKVPKEYLME